MIIITEKAKHSLIELKNNGLSEENIGCIYGHKNKETNFWYCGETIFINPEERWGENGSEYIRLGQTNKFANAIREFGWDSFDHYILEYCEHTKLYVLEQYYIDFYDSFSNGYNSNKGYGCEVSQETRKKQSNSQKGHNVSQKVIDRIRNLNKGKHLVQKTGGENPGATAVIMVSSATNDIIKKFSCILDATNYSGFSKNQIQRSIKNGKDYQFNGISIKWIIDPDKPRRKSPPPLSKEQREKRSEMLKGLGDRKTRPVLLLDASGNILRTFPSASSAARELNMVSSESHIRQCCRGERRSSGFYNGNRVYWKYGEK